METLVAVSDEDGVAAVVQQSLPAHAYCNICCGSREVVEDPTSGEKVCGGCLNPLYIACASVH